jgi:hypothetical protein
MAEETEVPGENLPQCHFVLHKSHMTFNPGRRGGKPATNRLSYGAICFLILPSMSRRKAGYDPTTDQEQFTSLHETRLSTAGSRGPGGPAGGTMLHVFKPNPPPLPHVVHISRTKHLHDKLDTSQSLTGNGIAAL